MVNVVLSDAINHHKDAINRRLYKRLIIVAQGSSTSLRDAARSCFHVRGACCRQVVRLRSVT
ncbi:hypothetical protein [Nostoc sp.]|uniref:hypothetical protein n=1 Tax=Nostoc sp. TaxID=1180 RepID=UPI002FF1A42E